MIVAKRAQSPQLLSHAFLYIILHLNTKIYIFINILWESLIIHCRAEARKIYGKILSKRRRYTDTYQEIFARLCREGFVLMRGIVLYYSLNVICNTVYSDKPHNQKKHERQMPKLLFPQESDKFTNKGVWKKIKLGFGR